MSDNKEFLGKEPVGKLLFRLALPTVAAQLINMLYNIVDRIYIGHMPADGALALTGVGVCMPIILIVSAFASLVGAGGAPRSSIFMGRKDYESAEKTLSQSFTLQILISVAITAILLIWDEDLLLAFGASGNTIGYATAYMDIYAIGTIFVQITLGMNYFITAQGFPLLGMATTLIGAVINIILDPVFIFLLDMDVAGAAMATVLAQMSSCAFVLCTLRRRKMRIRLGIVKPDLQAGKQIVKIGFSPFLIMATDSIIIIALNAVLQYYGGAEYGDTLITAATIVQSYMLLITSPMLGITGGSQPLISFNYGANRPDRIRKTFFWVLMLCVCFTAVMFLISRFMPQYFVRIFTSDPEYAELAVWGIKIFTLMIVPLSFQYVIVDGLTALGMTKISLSLSLLRKGIYFGATCVLPIFFAARSAFYAEPVSDGLAACLSCLVFFFISRKDLRGEGRLGDIKL